MADNAERFIRYGEFRSESLADGDDACPLMYDTRTDEIIPGYRDAVSFYPALWVPRVDDEENIGQWEWPDDGDEFDLGQPGLYDQEVGEFRTLDQWIDLGQLVLSPEFEAWENARRLNVAQTLRDLLGGPFNTTPPVTCYTVLSAVSDDGCRRLIRVVIPVMVGGKLEIIDITRYCADACGFDMATNYFGMLVSGCGMDMGFHVVNSVGSAIGMPDLRHEWL